MASRLRVCMLPLGSWLLLPGRAVWPLLTATKATSWCPGNGAGGPGPCPGHARLPQQEGLRAELGRGLRGGQAQAPTAPPPLPSPQGSPNHRELLNLTPAPSALPLRVLRPGLPRAPVPASAPRTHPAFIYFPNTSEQNPPHRCSQQRDSQLNWKPPKGPSTERARRGPPTRECRSPRKA